MAKKEEVKKTEKKVEKKAAFGKTGETLKFGVSDLAAMLDVDPATARVKLRKANVKKLSNNGASYGWNTKDELKAVADKLSAKPAKTEKAEKPAAKKDDKKAAKASTEKGAPAKDAKKAANDKGAKKSGKKAA